MSQNSDILTLKRLLVCEVNRMKQSSNVKGQPAVARWPNLNTIRAKHSCEAVLGYIS
jgi:hypothetical protein